MKDQSGLRRISIICFFLMLVMLIVHVQILVAFNRQTVNVHGNDSSSNAYMEINSRENSTSSWLKRGFRMKNNPPVDLTGQTIDQNLYNNSGDVIQEWSLRINITGDCFINQAWNGEVEIHQYTGSKQEAVQKLNLQDYVLEDVKLDYFYDGDLLIPLQEGDYVLYFPSERYTEMPVRSRESVRIGMIFYYLKELDLSDYDLTVHFHRSFTQGWSFIAFIAAAALWVLSSVVYGTSTVIYRNAQKQMELRKSGLSYMSGLYEAIYIINLPGDEISPVSPGDYIEDLRAKISSARELLQIAVRDDADENYMDSTLAFVNTDTLADRLTDRESIIWEFVSRLHGWCRFRFFAMDRTEGKSLENVIFAVQDINDERSEKQRLTERLEKAESAFIAGSTFLSDASRDLQAPVKDILALDERILQESDPGKVRGYAEDIRSTADRMLTLISAMAHRAEAEKGKGKAAAKPYSLRQLAAEAIEAVRPMAEKKGIRPETDIAEGIPDTLTGDAEKLKEVIVSLTANAISHSDEGSVRLSVFGKKTANETVHLLFSVQALPEDGEPPVSISGGKAVQAYPDLDLEVAGTLLESMGSGLKSVRSADDWKDVYFEIDQTIAEELKQ